MKTIRRLLFWILVSGFFFFLQRNLSALLSSIQINLLPKDYAFISKILISISWLAIFIILNILVNKIFWDRLFSRRIANKTPSLLKYISGFILIIIFVSLIVTQVFDKSITGILALSGGFGILLGFTLQNTINDFFSGIIIHLEKPFLIGDFIMLNNTRLGDEPLIGRVHSINWRTSRLQKTDGTMIVVPNNQFTKLVLTNFSLPEEKSRIELEFCVPYEFDTKRVSDVILTALYSLDSILKNPRPKVKVPRTTADGVIYQVRFWLLPTKTSPGRGRDHVNQAVIKYLHFAGITLSNARTEIFHAPIKDKNSRLRGKKKNLISEVPIFKSLSTENMEYLCDKMNRIQIKKGSTIVRQGQQESSMFLISEGHATVMVHDDISDKDKKVGKLGPGQFFGEMSLVLGDLRSATVKTDSDCTLYEINKETMQGLFQKDKDLLDHIVAVINSRKTKNQSILEFAENNPEIHTDTYELIKQKIQTLFKIF